MTDETETKTPTSDDTARSARQLRTLWRRYVVFRASKAELTWGQIIRSIATAGVIGIICLSLLFVGYRSARDEADHTLVLQSEAQTKQALQHQFDSDTALYTKKLADYDTCLATAQAKVDGRLNFRAFMLADADNFSAEIAKAFPSSDTALAVVAQLHEDRQNLLDQLEPVLDVNVEQAKCTPPGPVPLKPKGLN